MDKRRFNGPESAQPIKYSKISESSSDEHINAIKPIYMKIGLVGNASGSVYIESNETKLLAAVYGPKPTPPSTIFSPTAKLNVVVNFTPFATNKRLSPGKDTESNALAILLHQALLPSLLLHTLPKTQIDLFITILQSNSIQHDISAGITAASVALAAAGIQMYGLVTASHLVLQSNDAGTLTHFLDPTPAEAKSATTFASLACIPALGTVTSLVVNGPVSLESYTQVLETLFKSCGQIHAVSKQALIEDYASGQL